LDVATHHRCGTWALGLIFRAVAKYGMRAIMDVATTGYRV